MSANQYSLAENKEVAFFLVVNTQTFYQKTTDADVKHLFSFKQNLSY